MLVWNLHGNNMYFFNTRHDDASKAFAGSKGRTFFGTRVIVEEHDGFEVDDSEFRPPEAELDECHHKATRTLFVGNLEKDISKESLKLIFDNYGYVIVSISYRSLSVILCCLFVVSTSTYFVNCTDCNTHHF